MPKNLGPLIGALDEGTSSVRFLIFAAKNAEVITYHQEELYHVLPKEGWVEIDPLEIWRKSKYCMTKAVKNLIELDIEPATLCTVGITNMRETIVVWDKLCGKPLYNAILWLDARNCDTVEKLINKTPNRNKEYLKLKCGLPLSTYFSATKFRWLMDNSEKVREAIAENRCFFGTVDSWLMWNLTGGLQGGIHITDVTNASGTMLLNIKTLKWDEFLCKFFEIPMELLPEVKSSSEIYGYITTTEGEPFNSLEGLPISGILGDQQAALVGQMCFARGQAKNTYGTGCFLLYNTGREIIQSEHGLLTTVAYKMGSTADPAYALEGSVAVTGAAVRWLRDNLGIIEKSSEVETLAATVTDSGGVFFVPAFPGLFCPYWQPDARGVICGLTQHSNSAHIARATLEAVAFQTREILDAMRLDSGIQLEKLQVDGGMTENNLLMQLQADILGIPVIRPAMPETTALGAAMAAGAAEDVGVWSLSDLSDDIITDTFTTTITESERDVRLKLWKMAVKRSMSWETEKSEILKECGFTSSSSFSTTTSSSLFAPYLSFTASSTYLPPMLPLTFFLMSAFGLFILSSTLNSSSSNS